MASEEDQANFPILPVIIFGIVLMIFTMPATLVIWPFSRDFEEAMTTAFHSWKALLGSLAFWWCVYKGLRAAYRASVQQQN